MSKSNNGNKGSRKHGRNYRLPMSEDGFSRTGSVTRYRIDHAIPAGPRQSNHVDGSCPLHRGRMTHAEHLSNRMAKVNAAIEAERLLAQVRQIIG